MPSGISEETNLQPQLPIWLLVSSPSFYKALRTLYPLLGSSG